MTPKIVCVAGPTACGKTTLGVLLAQRFHGEVVSADSMQIYKGLDVGTAKVTPEETHGIPHHAVDFLEPDQTFSVADFYPAKLRPGAVGCQFLAGALGCVPLSVGWPGLTLPLALPYWLEGGMVALQIIVWKASGGRRQLFGTAPLHRWLEKRGFDPVNIFYIFGVLAMLGLALTLQAARAS